MTKNSSSMKRRQDHAGEDATVSTNGVVRRCAVPLYSDFGQLLWILSQVGLTDDAPLTYTVTIREIYTTVKKAEVSLIDGH